jgi:hypothetical protein
VSAVSAYGDEQPQEKGVVMLRRSANAIGIASALFLQFVAGPSAAQSPHCVVELFTSQGCSSCPPADRLVRELARDPNVVVISWPVDYWDYIGWKDTLALPAFTGRQKAYAAARGDGHLYTPQAVIDGLVHTVGSDRDEIETAIKARRGHKGALTVPVDINIVGGMAHIEIGTAPADAVKEASLWLVRIARERTVAIGRGENSGNTVTYTNVARSTTKIGDWNGRPASFEVPLTTFRGADSDGYVLLLQAGSVARPGVILGAAKGSDL